MMIISLRCQVIKLCEDGTARIKCSIGEFTIGIMNSGNF